MSIALDRRALAEARRLPSLLSRADLSINELPALTSLSSGVAIPAWLNGLTYQVPASLITASAASASTNIFNVKNFGATGNGVSDDAGSIQAALNTAGGLGGGRVYVPAGTYLLSVGLTMTSGVWMYGDGIGVTTLKTAQSGPVLFARTGIVPGVLGPGGMDVVFAAGTSDAAYVQNVAVEDMTIDASGTRSVGGSNIGYYGAGLTFANFNFARALRVRIYNTASFGLQLGWTNFSGSTPKSSHPIVQDCVLDSCGNAGGGDSIGGGVYTDGRILGNTCLNSWGNFYDNLAVDSTIVAYNTILAPQPSTPGSPATGRIQSDIGFDNSIIAFNKFMGGTLNQTGGFVDNPTFTTPTGGILLGGGSGTSSHPPTDVIIEGNVLFNTIHGIVVQSAAVSGGPVASTCRSIVVKNNVIWRVNGISASPNYSCNGIELCDADGCIIEGNVIRDWNQNLSPITYTVGGGGQVTANTQTWGVQLRGFSAATNGATNCSVRNNTFISSVNNAAQGGIYSETWNTNNNVFENNTFEMPQSPRVVLRSATPGKRITVLRNNTQLTLAGDTVLPTPGSFPLPTSGVPAQNNSGVDLVCVVVGGTVSAIVVNGVNIGVTSGSFLFPHGGSFTITYSVSPTSFVTYPITV